MSKVKCAIIGSGNIGTDLMLKIVNTSESLTLNGVIGIDPDSEGLAMAKSHDISISTSGLLGFMEMEEYHDDKKRLEELRPSFYDDLSEEDKEELDKLLEKEKQDNKGAIWIKLDKTERIQRLQAYKKRIIWKL